MLHLACWKALRAMSGVMSGVMTGFMTGMCLLVATLPLGAVRAVQAAELNPYHGITTVEVFANSAMLITPRQSANYRLKIYRLDGLQRIDTQINQGLPQNEAGARAWLAQNQAALRRKYEPQILDAAQGLVLAQRYKIDRLPCIVINQRSVVFGLTDVDQAIGHYQAWRQKHPEQRR